MLYRVILRDLQVGRVLMDRLVVPEAWEKGQTRGALADVVLSRPREGVAWSAAARLLRTSSVGAVAEAVGQAEAVGARCACSGTGPSAR